MIERGLYEQLWKELSNEKAMVFMAGPRQAGKTTFAKMLMNSFRISIGWRFVGWAVFAVSSLVLFIGRVCAQQRTFSVFSIEPA